MQKAVQTLQTLLKVKPHDNEYTFEDKCIKDLNIKEWDQSKIGTQAIREGKSMYSLGIDLIIFGTIETLDGATLASASAKYSAPTTGQPIIGPSPST